VQLTRGATCGRHCFALVVTLSDFPAGAHHVTCIDQDRNQTFGGYTTSSTTSTGCSYDHPHATVYVVVDGTRSNTLNT
jgi:hypothetical protein